MMTFALALISAFTIAILWILVLVLEEVRSIRNTLDIATRRELSQHQSVVENIRTLTDNIRTIYDAVYDLRKERYRDAIDTTRLIAKHMERANDLSRHVIESMKSMIETVKRITASIQPKAPRPGKN